MADRRKVLITGCQGRLGRELTSLFSSNWSVVGLSRADMDIRNKEATIKAIRDSNAKIVLHTAAWTDVDACERDPELAMAINCDGARNVALGCAEVDALIVHYSTDYVFDGAKSIPYVETDDVKPLSVYGRSKLEGERAVAGSMPDFLIMRIAWLYGPHGDDFVSVIMNRGQAQMNAKNSGRDIEPLLVVNDQIGSPTSVTDVARQTEVLIDSGIRGIVHAVNPGEVSRYQMACDLFDLAKLDVTVTGCSSNTFPRPAKRPPYSALENTRLRKAGLDEMRPYRDAITQFLESVGGEKV